MKLDFIKTKLAIQKYILSVNDEQINTLLTVCKPLLIITPLMLSWRIMNVFQSEDEDDAYKAAREILKWENF